MAMNPSSSRIRQLAGVGLGLFVLWQIVFLTVANALRLAADARPHLTTIPWAAVGRIGQRWAEVTGQPQQWSLFAPDVFENLPFPAVELRWDDERQPARSAAALLVAAATNRPLEGLTAWGAAESLGASVPAPVLLRSDNEPRDPRRFFRVGNFRLRRYEGTITPALPINDTSGEGTADSVRQRIETQLRDESEAMRAYLRWRLAGFCRGHADLPLPRQVILVVRQYRVPPPPGPTPWDWEGPVQQPIVRWFPLAEPGPEYYPIEMYNPVVPRFEVLRRPPPPSSP
jgi:hypothetical protein